MINYSIIIPHKNIPDLLQRCLDSIPRRDDVQIIVVDDNSDTDKVDFENLPGSNDPYVEIIFAKNENGRKGAGCARNLGLERAKGKWLVFADADDCFTDCFNEVLDLYKDDEKHDFAHFLMTSTDLKNGRHLGINNILCEIKKTDDWNVVIHGGPCGKFIKNNIVKGKIWFQEINVCEDWLFSVEVITCSKVKKIDTNFIIYCITERVGSLTYARTLQDELQRFGACCDVIDYLKKNAICNDEYYDLFFLFWFNVFLKNKKKAIALIPMSIQNFKLTAILKGITHNYPKLKNYWIWKKLIKK